MCPRDIEKQDMRMCCKRCHLHILGNRSWLAKAKALVTLSAADCGMPLAGLTLSRVSSSWQYSPTKGGMPPAAERFRAASRLRTKLQLLSGHKASSTPVDRRNRHHCKGQQCQCHMSGIALLLCPSNCQVTSRGASVCTQQLMSH